MPYKKKPRLSRKKGVHKKKWKNDKMNEGTQLLDMSYASDDYFRTCLKADENDRRMEEDLVEDNSTADEYYVILDQPYKYSEHDDLDTFVESKLSQLYHQFVTDQKSLHSENFVCINKDDTFNYIQLYDEGIVKIRLVVSVLKDLSVKIQVHDKLLHKSHKLWTKIPSRCYSVHFLDKILKVISSYRICQGNDDPDLQASISAGGYCDNYNGQATIRSFSCQLLVKGKRCRNCCLYRGTMRSISSKKKKNEHVGVAERDFLHTRIRNDNLTELQKIEKLSQYKKYTQSLKKELNSLKKGLKS